MELIVFAFTAISFAFALAITAYASYFASVAIVNKVINGGKLYYWLVVIILTSNLSYTGFGVIDLLMDYFLQ